MPVTLKVLRDNQGENLNLNKKNDTEIFQDCKTTFFGFDLSSSGQYLVAT